jgi:hypothetical protein
VRRRLWRHGFRRILLQNLAEALAQVYNAHGKALQAGNETLNQAPVTLPDGVQ